MALTSCSSQWQYVALRVFPSIWKSDTKGASSLSATPSSLIQP